MLLTPFILQRLQTEQKNWMSLSFKKKKSDRILEFFFNIAQLFITSFINLFLFRMNEEIMHHIIIKLQGQSSAVLHLI